MLVMCICMDLTRETRAMSKLLMSFSLLWSFLLFLAPVPTLGNFDSGDCTVDDSPDGNLVTSVTPTCSNEIAAVEVVARSDDDIQSEDRRHRSLFIRIDYICIHDAQQIRGTPWTTDYRDQRIDVTNLDPSFDLNNPQFTATVQQSLQQGTNCTFYLCYKQRTADSNHLRSTSPVSCVLPDINECETANGGCQHSCTNTIGSFNCSCYTGYQLDENGLNCSDINECDIANGGCEHNCTNTIGSFNCSCYAGYQLDENGSNCNDSNECNDANGGCQHRCTNTIGSFNCSCDKGYQLDGNGLNCSDIDECETGSDNCDEKAQCTNTEGSFTCSCDSGYTGDGTECSVVLTVVVVFAGFIAVLLTIITILCGSICIMYKLWEMDAKRSKIKVYFSDDVVDLNYSPVSPFSTSKLETVASITTVFDLVDVPDRQSQISNADSDSTLGTEFSEDDHAYTSASSSKDRVHPAEDMQSSSVCVSDMVVSDVHEASHTSAVETFTGDNTTVCKSAEQNGEYVHRDHLLQGSRESPDLNCVESESEFLQSTCLEVAEEVTDLQPHSVLLEASKDEGHLAKEQQPSIADTVACAASQSSAVEPFTGDINDTAVCHSGEQNDGYVRSEYLLQGSHDSPDMNSHIVELEPEFLQSMYLEKAVDQQSHSVSDMVEASKDKEHTTKDQQSSLGYLSDTHLLASVEEKPDVVGLQGLEDSPNHSVVEDDLSIGKMSPQLFSENCNATSDCSTFDNTTHSHLSVSQVQHLPVNRGYITDCSKSGEDIPHTVQQMN